MRRIPLERAALWLLYGTVAALQVSIAAAQTLLALMLVAWIAMLAQGRARPGAPPFFRALAVYAVFTLAATVFSVEPLTSLVDDKQLLLLLTVPAVYEIARGGRARTVLAVIITAGAASAVAGIVQYGMLHYNNLGQRPQGSLGHYMTYSGLLMLVAMAAAARLLFEARNRTWPALVMPALLVALALTFTRSAWVGASAGIAALLLLKDFRLLGALPVVLAVGIAIAPPQVTHRFYSMFDLNDPTSRDRVAMLREGVRMIAADPLTGMGPNMVERQYARFRDAEAVERVNPHLHNVPMQIAAERGLPALFAWLWFVGSASAGLWALLRRGRHRVLAAAGLGAVAAMLGAGMFEHNFGDSEFLLLLLVLVTLPFASERPEPADPGAPGARRAEGLS
ncbi:MAG TPA: O-antigen ligase family protein [Vicinamibacterales bacterium]|nr:O-antigen ligase family protein [Vicinamibacterales bacterium]HPW21615.1 O-antigen ligase family protein [Vicinamibacterales bacterium]